MRYSASFPGPCPASRCLRKRTASDGKLASLLQATEAGERTASAVASEAYHDWSGEATGARLRVNFTLKLLLSQNFCNRPLMRFISFASNIGPAAAVPAGPAPSPLKRREAGRARAWER